MAACCAEADAALEPIGAQWQRVVRRGSQRAATRAARGSSAGPRALGHRPHSAPPSSVPAGAQCAYRRARTRSRTTHDTRGAPHADRSRPWQPQRFGTSWVLHSAPRTAVLRAKKRRWWYRWEVGLTQVSLGALGIFLQRPKRRKHARPRRTEKEAESEEKRYNIFDLNNGGDRHRVGA